MKEVLIIKIGGQVVDDPQTLERFLQEVAGIDQPCILVHGGGKLATRLSEQMGIEAKMVEGRRITDAATLDIVTMVYGGLINKQIVAALQALGKNAIGLTGADHDLIRAKKRIHPTIDYGFVGDVTAVNSEAFEALLKQDLLPVIAALTHDGEGQLLNTNADTLAQSIAVALSPQFQTTLVFGFEKAGVLRDRTDESTLISAINRSDYNQLRANGAVADGMIPKLDNAFRAIDAGVKRVVIGKADRLSDLLNGKTGTALTYE